MQIPYYGQGNVYTQKCLVPFVQVPSVWKKGKQGNKKGEKKSKRTHS